MSDPTSTSSAAIHVLAALCSDKTNPDSTTAQSQFISMPPSPQHLLREKAMPGVVPVSMLPGSAPAVMMAHLDPKERLAYEKKQLKRAANRKSAQLSRKRKKQYIEELKEENDQLRRQVDILQNSPDVILVFDVESDEVNFVSVTVTKLLGFSPQELEGSAVWDLISKESVTELKDCMKQAQDIFVKKNPIKNKVKDTGSDEKEMDFTTQNEIAVSVDSPCTLRLNQRSKGSEAVEVSAMVVCSFSSTTHAAKQCILSIRPIEFRNVGMAYQTSTAVSQSSNTTNDKTSSVTENSNAESVDNEGAFISEESSGTSECGSSNND